MYIHSNSCCRKWTETIDLSGWCVEPFRKAKKKWQHFQESEEPAFASIRKAINLTVFVGLETRRDEFITALPSSRPLAKKVESGIINWWLGAQ